MPASETPWLPRLARKMKNARVPVTVQAFSAAMDACLRANNPDLALALSAELSAAASNRMRCVDPAAA